MQFPVKDREQVIQDEQIKDLYDSYVDTLYRFFYFKVLSREHAEDLTSETFVRFISQIEDGTAVVDYKNFLFGIARIVFANFLRLKYRIPFTEVPEDFGFYVEDFLEEVKNIQTPEERLAKYLPKLPQAQAQVLKLRLIEKLTPKEIAHALGRNIFYVKTTQNRALKSLRRLIAGA